jgi:hypothetical protein
LSFRDLRNLPSLCVPFKVVGSRSVPASYLPLEDAVPLEIQGSGECFLLSAFLLESWGPNAVGSTPLPSSFYPMGYDFVVEIEGESGTRSCSATRDEVPSALQAPFLACRIATITSPALSPFPSTGPCPLNVTSQYQFGESATLSPQLARRNYSQRSNDRLFYSRD